MVLGVYFLTSMNPRTLQTIDIKLCDSFEYPDLKITCLAFFSANESYCDLVENFISKCRFFSTVKMSIPDICKKIDDPYVRAFCFSNVAIKTKDPKVCEEYIKDPDLIEMCLSNVPYSYFVYFTDSECRILKHQSAKYTCLGLINKNSSLCELMTNEPFQIGKCKALIERNINMCKDSPFCFKDLALLEKNPELCEKVNSPWAKAECVGTLYKDFERCNELGGSISRDLCKLYALQAIELQI
ncbi:MAG: hypothetical protein J7K98_00895 [Candidatus Aenigmarchaeota archaeon]|nr:hypothetical protein [Candidatus Aenigmarchaeota archaeon]